jgi:S1-C subfamily serine protease
MTKLRDKLKELEVGQEIKLSFYRGEKLKDVKVKLKTRPEPQ